MTNEQLCALAKQDDADAQNLLIEKNLRFIKKTAYEVWNTQSELNRALHINLDDLVQEGALGLLGGIESYNPDSGNLFLTYAAPAIRNVMIDYIRSQNVSFEAKHLNDIVSLDDLAKDEVRSKHSCGPHQTDAGADLSGAGTARRYPSCVGHDRGQRRTVSAIPLWL